MALLNPGTPARRHPVAEAIDLLRANPEKAWTVGLLAAAVSVSVRSLQAGFHRSVNQTPMAYLRELRLEEAHSQLLEAGGGSVTVTEVATAWGFLHLGRFAQQYFQRFHELPSDTLAKSPR